MLSLLKDLFSRQSKQAFDAEQVVRKMGGDISKLTPDEQDALARTHDKMPKSMDITDWMAHTQEHGHSVMMENHRLMDKAGAYDERKALHAAKDEAKRAMLALDQPEPTKAQRAVLETLPKGPLRDHVQASLRTAIVFDLDVRPATSNDRSFCGGLPIAPKSREWPKATGRDGSSVACQFLCQIAVNDLPADYPLRSVFPEEGALYFFSPAYGEKTSAPLVQHHSLDGAMQWAPPPDLGPYESTFCNLLVGELKNRLAA